MTIDIPLGDATLTINLRIPGVRRFGFRIHVGVPADTTVEDRIINRTSLRRCPTGKAGVVMDLQADKQVVLTGEWTDEVGNPVPAPDDATVVYTVDDPTVINLTDNGDGTATAAAVGVLGTANVHADATAGDMAVSGDLQIVVVAGLAERFNITAGEPTEVTPDI